MALENGRYAVVNNSIYSIPVYEKTVLDGHFIGGSTVGGAQIGTIYPNEFYTLLQTKRHIGQRTASFSKTRRAKR